jgi:two-component system phosphate regulon response regulator PhoB
VPRILVVDDDADIRDMLSFKLANSGFEVHTEEDGETGVAAALELRPDLVVLDWMMPRMTGPEVCVALRQDPATERLPVILLTAKAQEGDVQRGFASGADDYVCKPFSPRELVSRVQALLARAA